MCPFLIRNISYGITCQGITNSFIKDLIIVNVDYLQEERNYESKEVYGA